MTNKNLYISCIVMKDSETGDLTGLARPVIAESESEALNVTLNALKESAPEIESMDEVLRMVKELPRSFIEQAAEEVLGWSKPEAKSVSRVLCK